MENVSIDIRKKCHQMCRDYLGGIWGKISAEDILIEKLTGGHVSLSLRVSLPENVKALEKTPSQAVLKIKVGVLPQNHFRQITENIMAVMLAEKGLAPKVYGIFDDGRLDEYIVSRTLSIKDYENPEILSAIARKLAHLHSQNLPINKNPNRSFNFRRKFLQAALNDPRNKLGNLKRDRVLKKLIDLNPEDELEWLNKESASINPLVVFTHGDLHYNNILLPRGFPDESLYFIDYDASGYGYRGSDFANLFNSFCMTIPYPETPFFKCHWDNFPSINQQEFIIRNYLVEFEKSNGISLNVDKEIDQILRETDICLLAFYFSICIFCLIREDENKQVDQLDWLEFCDMAITRYSEIKKINISL